jgi:hypothetical protein
MNGLFVTVGTNYNKKNMGLQTYRCRYPRLNIILNPHLGRHDDYSRNQGSPRCTSKSQRHKVSTQLCVQLVCACVCVCVRAQLTTESLWGNCYKKGLPQKWCEWCYYEWSSLELVLHLLVPGVLGNGFQ